MKTLAIRLEDELHGRLTLLAQLTNVTITDAIRAVIEAHLSKLVTDPQLAARVEQLLADIEREANQRKQVITDLFSGNSANDLDALSLASGITLQDADDEAAPGKPPSAVAPSAGSASKRTSSRGGASSRPQK